MPIKGKITHFIDLQMRQGSFSLFCELCFFLFMEILLHLSRENRVSLLIQINLYTPINQRHRSISLSNQILKLTIFVISNPIW